MIYRLDGTIHPGPRSDYTTYGREFSAANVGFGDRFLRIGSFRLGDVDGWHASISHSNGNTATIFRGDGTIHNGPRRDWNTNARSIIDVCGDDRWLTAVDLSADGTTVVQDIGRDEFNRMFRSCPVVRYFWNHDTYAIYVRTTRIPDFFDAYSMFTYTWRDTNNELNIDFNLYSNYADAENENNHWTFCNYNDPDVGFPRDCGVSGFVPHRWFSMPGDRFTRNTRQGFELFNSPNADSCIGFQDDRWLTAVDLSADGTTVVQDIGRDEFNRMFRSCPVVRYFWNDDTYAIYVRTTRIPDSFDAYSMFTYTWRDTSNELNIDFNLYSNYTDAENENNHWTFCNYNDPDVGFPRDCGVSGYVPHRWFSMPGDRFTRSTRQGFELFNSPNADSCIGFQAPSASPTASPTSSPTLPPSAYPSASPTPSPTATAPATGPNVYEIGVMPGGWGGSCTCPNGEVYQVADNYDYCDSLACIGGTPGQCNRHNGEWSNNRATCAVA